MPSKSSAGQRLSESLTGHLANVVGLKQSHPNREDSRAFGAMLEKRLLDGWPTICQSLGASPLPRPGRRTIYDMAMRHGGAVVGLDVKTKDLDSTAYSDGGVCSVDNLIQFLVRDNATLMLAEIAHRSHGANRRIVDSVRVAPLHLLPACDFRIENLGTGQVRLNRPLHVAWADIDWYRTLPQFLDIFTDLAISHFERVGDVAAQRAAAMRSFRAGGYARLVLP